MLSRAESCFLDDIAALCKRIETGRLKSKEKIQRAIGKLQKKHPRAARFYTLLQAEEGFACLKGSLGLRPNFHQLEHRVEAHVFISVLACHLLTWIRETLRDAGETRDWKTLRRLLSSHSLVTTALPLQDGSVLRIRKPSQPDPEQSLLYQKLRIDWKAAFRPLKSFAKP